VVLADEPTGSLHWKQGERIMEMLRELNQAGTTIIQVSHDARVAAFGQRIVELGDGWITSDRRVEPTLRADRRPAGGSGHE
jgi:ABC-type lipoprotein export system ATPase subunit